MIDGIHCRVDGDSYQNIIHCDKLQFANYPNRSESKYKGLIITIYKENRMCYLRGSIHKFKNDGIHNADLFTYQDFIVALNKLESELGIYGIDLYVMRFEIGVNVPLGYPVWQCINTITLINNRVPTKGSHDLLVKYQQYCIKVYSKSKQYRMFKDDNILRIEIAYERKIKLAKDICKIETLDEVVNPSIWIKMGEVLKLLVSRFVFFDYSEIRKEEVIEKELLIFHEWSNPVRVCQEPNRSRRFRYKRLAYDIYLKYSRNTKAKGFIKLVAEKINEMLVFEANTETN